MRPLTIFIIAFTGVLAAGLMALLLIFWVERGRGARMDALMLFVVALFVTALVAWVVWE